MEEQIVTYEIAKLAKEKGFDVMVKGSYTEYLKTQTDPEYPDGGGPFSMVKGEVDFDNSYFKNNGSGDYSNNNNYNMCAAPTQALLQKWLREHHKIYVSPRESWSIDNTLEFVCTVNGSYANHTSIDKPINRFDTYEDAMEAGLKLGLSIVKHTP